MNRLTILALLACTALPAAAQTAKTDAVKLAEMRLKAEQYEMAARNLNYKARQLQLQAERYLVEAQKLRVTLATARLNAARSKASRAPKPETTKPEKIKPEKIKPETIKPEKIEPETIKPEKIKPESTKPVPKAVWLTPKLTRKAGPGKWEVEGGSVKGSCPAGRQYTVSQFGSQYWQDYVVEFEVKATKGVFGIYLRGGTRGAQFPGLPTALKMKADPEHWYAVRAIAKGGKVTVAILNKAKKWVGRTQANPKFTTGHFGFVLIPGSAFEVRKLRVNVTKAKSF